jgi:PBP1b-binding outer membrane lipoprotein LpoB
MLWGDIDMSKKALILLVFAALLFVGCKKSEDAVNQSTGQNNSSINDTTADITSKAADEEGSEDTAVEDNKDDNSADNTEARDRFVLFCEFSDRKGEIVPIFNDMQISD